LIITWKRSEDPDLKVEVDITFTLIQKNLEQFVNDLDTQDGSKGQEESGPAEKAAAVYEVASELREGGNDRLEKLVDSGI